MIQLCEMDSTLKLLVLFNLVIQLLFQVLKLLIVFGLQLSELMPQIGSKVMGFLLCRCQLGVLFVVSSLLLIMLLPAHV